ncbi:sugar ABC transporter substrate-binding protein [Neomoorella humiferrea]|uniref:ABC transporter substrate-binding protein n=1 Tax=Neomoorella humiferrea TaxID=676965 RepID=UPI003D92172E
MLKKKWAPLTLVLVLVAMILTACGGGSSGQKSSSGDSQDKEEITFVNWASAEESTREYVNKVIAEFEKQNPNIKVKSIPVSVSDMLNQLTIMVTGGNAPDVAQILASDGVTLAAMGAIEETDNLVSKELASDPYFKKSWDLGLYKDKHYGIPWALQPLGFWYNKKLMQEAGLDPNKPPKTWEEFNKYMDQARQKLPKETVIIGIDTTIRTIGLEQEWSYIRSFGALPVDGDKVAANSQQMINYATWLRKMVKEGYTLPGKKFGEFRPLAAQNRLVFTLDGPQFKGVVKSINKNMTDQEFYNTWGLTSLPAGVDGKSYAAPDDHHLLIFKASKHKEAALKFAEFLASNEVSLKEYIYPVGLLPATKTGFDKLPDLFGDNVRKAYVNEVLPNVVPLPVGPNLTKIATVIMAGMQEVVTTDKPIIDILNTVQTKLEGIIYGK